MVGSVASLRVLRSHFQGPGFQDLVSQGLRVPGPGSHGPRFLGLRVPDLRVLGLKVPGPGFQRMILDYTNIKA